MDKKVKILIRFDDLCPTMDWTQWRRAKEVLDSIRVTALLGVIPDNQDPELKIDVQRDDFWEYIKKIQKDGFTIAMHGYQHVFDIQASGLSTPKKHSEFAGHPFELQYKRIKEGKRVLNEHGIETDVFFAPAHSYDDNTLKSLASNGFKYLSDGKSLKPYKRHGIVCYPELTGGIPRLNGFTDYYTAVFHVHEWVRLGNEHAFEKFNMFCQTYKDEIVSFEEYKGQSLGWPIVQRGCEAFYMGLAGLKHRLQNL